MMDLLGHVTPDHPPPLRGWSMPSIGRRRIDTCKSRASQSRLTRPPTSSPCRLPDHDSLSYTRKLHHVDGRDQGPLARFHLGSFQTWRSAERRRSLAELVPCFQRHATAV